MKKIDKYNTFSPNILEYLQRYAKKSDHILDVGCWTGALGLELQKQKYKNNYTLDGIELNTEAIKKAKKSGYRTVFNINLNHLDNYYINQLPTYDIIIFGDVLEHTQNPEKVLIQLKTLLKPTGMIAISLPNIGFIYFRLTHLFGKWDYTETGIMDKTHLKFFTVKSATKLINNSNLKVIEKDGYAGIENKTLIVRSIFKRLAKIYPPLFAIQMTFLVKPNSDN